MSVPFCKKKLKKSDGFRLKMLLKVHYIFIVITSSNVFDKLVIMKQIKFNPTPHLGNFSSGKALTPREGT